MINPYTIVDTYQFFQVTPFLLRLFLNEGRHSGLTDYTNTRMPPKDRELQIYTWLDANLGELTSLIRELEKYQTKGTQFSYNVVFPDNHGQNYRMRSLGMTTAGKKGADDELTLAKSKYQIGDYLDVAILSPGADTSQINNHLKSKPKNRADRVSRNRIR